MNGGQPAQRQEIKCDDLWRLMTLCGLKDSKPFPAAFGISQGSTGANPISQPREAGIERGG